MNYRWIFHAVYSEGTKKSVIELAVVERAIGEADKKAGDLASLIGHFMGKHLESVFLKKVTERIKEE